MSRTTSVHRIVGTLAAGAIVATVALALLGTQPSLLQWQASAFFAGFGLLATVLAYRTSSATVGSIGFLPFLSIALISPNVAAVTSVIAGALASEIIARRSSIKLVFNVSQYVFAEVLAIGAYLGLGGSSFLLDAPRVPAVIGMVATWMVLNKLAVSTIVAASTGGVDTRRHWLRSMRQSFVYDALAFPLIAVVALAYVRWGPLWSAALALPLLGLRQVYKTNIALQKINEELLQLMAASIEARDPYTSGHSQRVARFARIVSQAGGLSTRETDRVVTAALLHDVGKIHEEFGPILRKPGRLTESEFEMMKTHAAKSAALVRQVSHFSDLVPMVRSHHEAWNGGGYPDQLSGTSIPLGARVIAIADTIDAMTSSRPYRDALSLDAVRAELSAEAGVQFDPKLCRALVADRAWAELERELAIATAEYPVQQSPVSTAPVSVSSLTRLSA